MIHCLCTLLSKDHKQVCTSITKQGAVSVVCLAKSKSDNEDNDDNDKEEDD